MNQTTATTPRIDARARDIRVTSEPSVLAKAVTAYAFSDLTVRPGQGLPPTLPWRQKDWSWMKF
jgi:hypothetical protein